MPVPQVFVPPQHAWPAPPHGWHIAGVVSPGGLMQTLPALHVPLPPPPGQHGWFGPPQVLHIMPPSVPATQAAPG
jgi:hypothetical protein